MHNIANPFIVSGKIRPHLFCDREHESTQLVDMLVNGNNVLLISPRRMGKTGLINFCFDKPQISDVFNTFYVDILSTSSLREFIVLLGREIYSTLQPAGAKLVGRFAAALKSVAGSFGFDAISGTPTFNLQIGDIRDPEYTLREIFDYLGTSAKPCIVAIDEFQQVSRYPERNIEALLRSYMQKLDNTRFIFAGSERHMLMEMFMTNARPFYLSSSVMELKPIDHDVYADFAERLFNDYGKEVERNAVMAVYRLFSGHTYYLQRTMNIAFAHTEPQELCTIATMRSAVLELLQTSQTVYREMLSNVPERHKQLMIAIANAGAVKSPLSAQFVSAHGLPSASAVQNSLKYLLRSDLVTRADVYTVTDPLLGLWIRSTYGPAPFTPL